MNDWPDHGELRRVYDFSEDPVIGFSGIYDENDNLLRAVSDEEVFHCVVPLRFYSNCISAEDRAKALGVLK